MLSCLTWISDETSQRLTDGEVNVLFNFCKQMDEMGQLNNGKQKGSNVPLYWQRTKGNN